MNGNGASIIREMRGEYENLSKQPRFGAKDPSSFLGFFTTWAQQAEDEAPLYNKDSRVRDAWLRKFVKKEPNLLGILSSVVDIDKNRGWRMVGGRNQVLRYTSMLHNFEVAPGLYGWRPAISFLSESFWSTDMGALTEIGRDEENGPVRALFTVDPARCRLTGETNLPLEYFPKKSGGVQKWTPDDYIRISSMISTEEDYNGLGYCAISRCVELAQLMLAVYMHDKEQLGAKAPRGLLLLKGITSRNWTTAMESRTAEMKSKGYEYFGPLAVLASMNASADAKLIALSQLPVSFNMRDWMDMIIFGYALCFKYDASEFYPVQFGAMGRGTETEIQHEKATGKGRLDFALGYQEQLQFVLPKALQYQFDQRDEKGELLHASVNQAFVTVAKTLYEAGATQGLSLLSIEESRTLLADWNVIPRSWIPMRSEDATDIENPGSIDKDEIPAKLNPANNPLAGVLPIDEKPSSDNNPAVKAAAVLVPQGKSSKMTRLKEELLSNPYVFRAAQQFPKDAIVQYSFPANTILILWESGEDLLKPRVWSGF